MKVLIIGGGASGMMAALSALENPNNTVTLLERQSRVGKKLLATGNGRCNLTNRNIRLSHYHGEQPEFARFALESFYVGRTLAFFERLGLLTVTEDSGKVYPLSDQASSVLDVLRFALSAGEHCDQLRRCRGQAQGKRLRGAVRDRRDIFWRQADHRLRRCSRKEARRQQIGLSFTRAARPQHDSAFPQSHADQNGPRVCQSPQGRARRRACEIA